MRRPIIALKLGCEYQYIHTNCSSWLVANRVRYRWWYTHTTLVDFLYARMRWLYYGEAPASCMETHVHNVNDSDKDNDNDNELHSHRQVCTEDDFPNLREWLLDFFVSPLARSLQFLLAKTRQRLHANCWKRIAWYVGFFLVRRGEAIMCARWIDTTLQTT